MKYRIARGIALASSMVVLTACGDDGGEDANGTETTSGSTTITTTNADATSADPVSTTDPTADPTTGSGSTTDPSTTSGSTSGSSTGGSTGEPLDTPDIVGTYVENFPGGQADHEITATRWFIDFGMNNTAEYAFAIVDNGNTFVVGEDQAQPGVFAKLQWTMDSGLYYCTVVFDATSADEAAAATPADDTDLAAGCGGFGWSLLEPE